MPGGEKHGSNSTATATTRRDIIYYPGASQQLGKISNLTLLPTTRQISIDSPKSVSTKEGFSSGSVNRGDTVSHNESEKAFELDWVKHHQKQHSTSRISAYDHKSEAKYSSESRPKEGQFAKKQRRQADNRYLGNMQTNQAIDPTRIGMQFQNDQSTTLNFSNTELNTRPADDQFEGQILDGQMAEALPEVKQRMSNDYNHLDEPIMDTLMRDLKGIYSKMKIIALPLSSYDIYKVVLRGWDLWGPLILCTFLAFNLHHSESSKDNHTGPHFADVFVLVWFGSCLVSLNYRLLSISASESQLSMMTLTKGKPMGSVDSEMNFVGKVKTGSESLSGSQAKISMVHEGIEGSQSSLQHPQPLSASNFQTLISPPSILQLMCVFGYCLVAPCFGLTLLKIFPFNRLFYERAIVGLLFGFAWPTFCSVRILIRYQHPEKRALSIYPIALFYFVLSCMIILNH